jgi:hypothetical protein
LLVLRRVGDLGHALRQDHHRDRGLGHVRRIAIRVPGLPCGRRECRRQRGQPRKRPDAEGPRFGCAGVPRMALSRFIEIDGETPIAAGLAKVLSVI